MDFWSSLAVEVIGGIVTAALFGAGAAWFTAAHTVRIHDERVADLEEDNRRWFRDRDRTVKIEKIESRNALREQAETEHRPRSPAAVVNAWAAVQAQALSDYVDDMSVKRRRYRELRGLEGRTHELVRKASGRPFPRFELIDEQRAVLDSWREAPRWGLSNAVVVDATRPELEPDFHRFEAEGDPPRSS